MIKRYASSIFRRGPSFWSSNHPNYSTLSSDNQFENLISLLQSCQKTSQTAQIHALMIKAGLDQDPFPLSKLLAQVSIQDIQYATSIFNHIESTNLYMFNTMLRGYSISDDPQKGLILFNRMRNRCYKLDFDQFTFISVLKCCSNLLEVRVGLVAHSVILRSGFDSFLNVENALMHFYCVCKRIKDAHKVFDELSDRRDLVSWNTLMGGYLCVAQYESVVHLFKQLIRFYGVSVSTILNVLSALEESRNISLGICLHSFCLKIGFLLNLNVITALISMYSKNGHIHNARRLFDEIDAKKDIVMWNCLIDGYARNGLLLESLELLKLMKHDYCVKPNSSTLAGLLSACSTSGSLAIGQYIHNYINEQRLTLDVVLVTALVDMYARNGFLEKAISVFEKMERKDIKCWTVMILSYGVHGQAKRAITLFDRMEKEGFKPNEVTFLAVLNSCSHGGLVAEGVGFFKRMVEVYELRPSVEHYGCMIDLLGRAGLLEEAYGLIKGLPVEKDATAWRALLGASRVYGYVELAERVKGELEEIGEECPSDSIAVYGAYAEAGLLPYCGDVLERRVKEMNCGKKEAGFSTIEV
ncbi:hypothetical protein CASFOL_016022 [Castilleja foliolosa]|uniref:Pentatricopeptide repeat-containing protein n=1 Tax=Castilleja foliolosa TaxID=1961234 RepID=A0ABD3DGT3_9LAMI